MHITDCKNSENCFRTVAVDGTINITDADLARAGGNLELAVQFILGPTGFVIDDVTWI